MLTASLLCLLAHGYEQSPFPAPQVLRGGRSEIAFVVEVPASGLGGPLSLELPFRASERLSGASSWLQVEVDGVPHVTTSLGALRRGGTGEPWRLTLPALPPGFHAVTVQAALRIDDDPCLQRDADAAWVTLSDTARVHAPSRAGVGEGALSLPALPAVWQAHGAAVLDVPGPPTPDTVAAVLEASRLLAGWGVALVPASAPEATGLPRLRLSHPDSRPDDAWLEPLRSGDAAQAVVSIEGESLEVVGRSPAALAGALRSLGQPVLRARCGSLPCVLGTPPPLPPAPTEEGPTARLELGDLGMSRGWVADGRGRHELELSWSRPSTWTVSEAPTLVLDVTLPEGVDLDPSHSHLTAWVAGTPLQTWSLDEQVGTSRLVARLPPELWGDDVWSVRLEATLEPEGDDKACERLDDAGAWLRVSAGSGLEVPRQEARWEGLAGAERRSRSGVQVVYSEALDWPQWVATAAVARALPRASGVVERPEGCEGLCVVPRPLSDDGLPEALAADLVAGVQSWHDRTGRSALPLRPAATRPMLHASGCASLECDTLDIWLPAESAIPEPPPLTLLSTRSALWDDGRWLAVGAPRAADALTVHAGQDSGPAHHPSDDARALRRLDQLILAALVAVLGLGALWVTRRDEGPPRQRVEVE